MPGNSHGIPAAGTVVDTKMGIKLALKSPISPQARAGDAAGGRGTPTQAPFDSASNGSRGAVVVEFWSHGEHGWIGRPPGFPLAVPSQRKRRGTSFFVDGRVQTLLARIAARSGFAGVRRVDSGSMQRSPPQAREGGGLRGGRASAHRRGGTADGEAVLGRTGRGGRQLEGSTGRSSMKTTKGVCQCRRRSLNEWYGMAKGHCAANSCRTIDCLAAGQARVLGSSGRRSPTGHQGQQQQQQQQQQPGGRYLPAWQDDCTGNGTSSGHAALCVFAPAAHRQAPGAAVKPTLPWESHIASARPALISTRAFYGAVLEGGASNKGPPVRTQFNERGLAAGPVSAAVVDVAAVPPLESSTGPRSTKHKPSLASPASGARTEKKKAGGGPPMPAAPTGLGLASTHDACGWRPPISARAAPPPLPCVAPVSVEPASFRAQDRPSECQFITHRPISQCQSSGITLSPWAIPRLAMAIRMPYSLPLPCLRLSDRAARRLLN
ncbi:hypothetical protein ACCO45_010389 [Purpureocillium lilacinum]|uniref:Uncharacterized protein n=1 Tax=Purpureocillium lilacinum TaxID=33203 RepID=A0ACC4DER0_PURLI